MGQIRGIFSFGWDYFGPLRSKPGPTPPPHPNPSYVPERRSLYYQAHSPRIIPPTRAALPRALPWQQSSATPAVDSTVLDALRA